MLIGMERAGRILDPERGCEQAPLFAAAGAA
jgi:hypothetical protein